MVKKNNLFDIKSMLNESSIKETTQKRKKINYQLLIPHEKNHYSLNDIEELADSIESVGLLQDCIVKPIDEGKYVIVAGHRRSLAIKMLVEERGLKQFVDVPCYITDRQEDDVITQLKLHMTNTTARDMTEYDKMQAVAETKRLIMEAKERGFEIKGKTREIVGDALNLGNTQVQKYLSIMEQAAPEVKEALKKGEITVQEAYDTTRPKKEKTSKKGKPTKSQKGKNEELSQKIALENDIGWQPGTKVPKNNCFVNAIFDVDGRIVYKLMYFNNGKPYSDIDATEPFEMQPLTWHELPPLPNLIRKKYHVN